MEGAETPSIDLEKVSEYLSSWIENKVIEADKSGGVVGLSGGLDSSVTAALLYRAFPENSLGVILPCESEPEDREDAYLAAETIGISVEEVNLDEIFQDLLFRLRKVEPGKDKIAEANIKPRLRMTVLYYLAARRDALVIGTDNWSELTTGYFTKHGDGGIDIAPLGRLVKTEVRELAYQLGIPEKIINRRPSAGLWEGQADEDELGMSYEQIDRYILTGKAEENVKGKVEKLKNNSRHKIEPPPVPEREKIREG